MWRYFVCSEVVHVHLLLYTTNLRKQKIFTGYVKDQHKLKLLLNDQSSIRQHPETKSEIQKLSSFVLS